jgi:hypothetical protein
LKGCVRRNAVVKVVEEGVVWFCVWCMWGVLSRTTHLRLACVHNIHGYVTATSQLRHSYVTATSQLPLKSLRIYDSPATILPIFCTFRSTEPCTLSVELPLTECSEVSPSYVEERRSKEERRGAKKPAVCGCSTVCCVVCSVRCGACCGAYYASCC